MLAGARIGGVLSLRHAQLENKQEVVLNGERLDVHVGVDCSNLRASGELLLQGAHIGGQLDFDGARLSNDGGRALTAARLQVDGDMFCGAVGGRTFEATGELWLLGAHIGGQLNLAGAHLSNEGGRALTADWLQVGGGMFCGTVDGQTFEATGELSLIGAHVGGQLVFDGARLSNEGVPALSADGLQVDGGMFCGTVDGQTFEATGELRLPRARIGARLSFEGAHLSTQGVPALFADGLHVDGDMSFRAVDGHAFRATGELRLGGAHIGGQLAFARARLSNKGGRALSANGLQVDGGLFCGAAEGQTFEATGELSLIGAHIGGQLNFDGAHLSNEGVPALSADGLQVDGGMFCGTVNGQTFEATGELRLPRARIGAQLNFEGAHLSTHGVPALFADGLQVDGDMVCRAVDGHAFRATGELRLVGAHIGGQLAFVGGRLSNDGGRALTADWLQVDEGLICGAADGQTFEATGELRLLGAHIGGQLNFDGARLSTEGVPALFAPGLQVDGDMFCRSVDGQGFEATGELSLLGARIGGQLDFADARLSNADGLALDLEAVEAAGLWLPCSEPIDGIVDLTDAAVGQFHDGWEAAQRSRLPQKYRARIGGFVYQSLRRGSDDRDARLDWLRHAADGSQGYVPQAYDQLAAVFKRAGREEDARRVEIEKQRRRRQALPVPARVASYFLDVTVSYGYRTWRAVYALLAVILIGWAVFAAAFPEHMRPTRPVTQLPTFHAWLYSIDAVLPVVNLGQESAWTPTGAAQVWYAFSVLAGWLLGLGFVAYFTARLFRE